MRRLCAFLTILFTLAFGLVSCASVDPYTGEEKTSNTTTGASIGAISGAILGAATSSKSDREKGIVTGAIVGGAIGAGIGHYMDQQEAALRERLVDSGVQVRREGDNIRLIMPGNITFAVNRYEIKPDFYEILNSVSEVLIEFDQTAIRIAGHTDSTGSFDYNQTLSEQRAGSVRSYLISRNVAAQRIKATGYGPRYPIADNGTEAGRQANRRVEMELQPL